MENRQGIVEEVGDIFIKRALTRRARILLLIDLVAALFIMGGLLAIPEIGVYGTKIK